MSKHLILRCTVWTLATLVAAMLAVTAWGAGPGGEAARLDSFSGPDGTNYFALSLKPAALPASGPRDVVVLVSTAASQIGDYRSDSLAAARAAMGSLQPGDRAKLVAFDLAAIPLTKDFVAPNSPEMAQAMASLDRRTPLGTNDIEKALTAALKSYRGDASRGRAIVYIGDGSSRANPLGAEQLDGLASNLAADRIPVISYAIGLRVDSTMLRVLAGRTGGLVLEDSLKLSGADAGRKLAAAADATVLWPTKAQWPADVTEVYPKTTPPLRPDRDTVFVGVRKGNDPLEVRLTADSGAGPQALAWTVPPTASDKRNSYLPQVVDRARAVGSALPLVDTSSLLAARDEVNLGVMSLAALARQALETNDLKGAERLINEALRRNPNDREALGLKDELAKRQQGVAAADSPSVPPAPTGGAGAPPLGAANDLNLVGAAPELPPAPDDAGGVANTFGQKNRMIEQASTTQVQNVVNQARGRMGTDPEGAIQALNLQLETIKQIPELSPETREQLASMVQRALTEGRRRQVEVDARRQRAQENLAQARERQLVNDNLIRNQQKLKQLMDRFDSLMAEGRYRIAEESAAIEAAKMFSPTDPRPEAAVPLAATLTSRMTGSWNDQMAVRVARQKGVIDMLYQCEKASIPMPDEPPIVYPDAEVWKELTARRKDKYSSQDLSRSGPSEKKIQEALKSPTQLEFIETPLSDVIDYLKDYHNIEIQLDKKSLDDMSIGTDTPVTKNLKGVSLRSALRLMLREMGLTYVIQDEVLLITTPEQAETRLTTKVYPVADLVVPIDSSSLMGMSMMGGMMGGGMMGGGMMGGGMMGGGMGGMGGMGMGGMGGMGMGGMGGGMGMGMFSVPVAR